MKIESELPQPVVEGCDRCGSQLLVQHINGGRNERCEACGRLRYTEAIPQPLIVVTLGSEDLCDPLLMPEVRARLMNLVETGHRAVLLDLAHVTYMPSTAMAALLSLGNKLSQQGGWLGMCNLAQEVSELLWLVARPRRRTPEEDNKK